MTRPPADEHAEGGGGLQDDAGEVLGLARTLVDQLHGLQARIEHSYSTAESFLRSAAVPAMYHPLPLPGRPAPPPPPVDLTQLQALLDRFEAEQRSALERHQKVEVQSRTLLEGLPELIQQAFEKLEEQNRNRIQRLWQDFQEDRERQAQESEGRLVAAIRHGVLEARSVDAPMREDLMRVIKGLDAALQKQRGEVRFFKALFWLSASALALVFVLVGYVVLPRL